MGFALIKLDEVGKARVAEKAQKTAAAAKAKKDKEEAKAKKAEEEKKAKKDAKTKKDAKGLPAPGQWYRKSESFLDMYNFYSLF